MRDPRSVLDLSDPDLDLVIRLARRVRLLGNLALALKQLDVFDALPLVARDQFESALAYADARVRVAQWEMNRVALALRGQMPDKLIAMKGCAYLLLNLGMARGRIFADVDLMVSEVALLAVERSLNEAGWETRELSPYDDNYYRKWTHELPPMVHPERQVEIDLHHNLLPRTARLKPDAGPILDAAVPVEGTPYWVLSNADIVLHGAVHLMVSDEMADKLRDLWDLKALIEDFAEQNQGFWQDLASRADTLGLQRPTYYTLRYCSDLLGLIVPEDVESELRAWAPGRVVLALMDALIPLALLPGHPDQGSIRRRFARWLLFVRSHWLRMPPTLLVYHLSNKLVARARARRGKQ